MSTVAAAYDRCASAYDGWSWQDVWTLNEQPRVEARIAALAPNNTRILRAWDCGAGTGRYLPALERAGYRVVATDVSPEMLRLARLRSTSRTTRFVCADAMEAEPPRGPFDLVLACRVLSHHPDLERFVARLASRLRPGGTLLVTDLDAEHDYARTAIPSRDGKVSVPTFKHRLADVVRAAEAAGLVALAAERVPASALLLPDRDIPSLARGSDRPVCTFSEFRRPLGRAVRGSRAAGSR